MKTHLHKVYKVHKMHKKHNGASTWCKVENILKRRSWGFFLTKERYLQRSQSILSSGVVPKKEPGEEANPHSICAGINPLANNRRLCKIMQK